MGTSTIELREYLQSEEFASFKAILLKSIEGINSILKKTSRLERFFLKRITGTDFNELKQILDFDTDFHITDWDEINMQIANAAAIIKSFCWLAVMFYEWRTFIPFARIIARNDYLNALNIDFSSRDKYFVSLTKRELFTALKMIDDFQRRSILSICDENYSELYDAVLENDYNKFCENIQSIEYLKIISWHVVGAIIRNHFDKKINKTYESITNIFKYDSINDAVGELLPSLESLEKTFDNINIKTEDHLYVPLCLEAYSLFENFISEGNAIMNYVIGLSAVGMRQKKKISELQSLSRFLTCNNNVVFDGENVNFNEISKVFPVLTNLALRLIRNKMDRKELTLEYEESEIGRRFGEFIKENFTFAGDRENKFKNSEFHYFKQFCEFLKDILEKQKGTQKWTYAFIYLFFPVNKKQKSGIDSLIGKRLDEKFMRWKEEPGSTDEALERLIKFFPELKKNLTDGQPSLESRSREALSVRMMYDNGYWIKSFIREVWHKDAIEKCFPKLKV